MCGSGMWFSRWCWTRGCGNLWPPFLNDRAILGVAGLMCVGVCGEAAVSGVSVGASAGFATPPTASPASHFGMTFPGVGVHIK